MHYYHVWVRSNRYRGNHALTYVSKQPVRPGALVRVELQRLRVLGIVVRETSRPAGRMQLKAIEAVLDLPPLPKPLRDAAVWLQQYYRASIGSVAQSLVPANIPQKLVPLNLPTAAPLAPKLQPLTGAQAGAVKTIQDAGSYLLHGRTGSGKTRIYQELALRALEQGRSVIVLSPEISLTGQLAESFAGFGTERVIVMHSAMTSAERLLAWRRIAEANESAEPLIVIGPRSALFSPLERVGLIIVDEAHEPAYKQEQEPRYHASRLAAFLAARHKAILLLGSATPPVLDYYLASQKGRPIIRLTELAKPSRHSLQLDIIDLKDRSHFTKSGILSTELITAMSRSYAAGEQSLLYLNRRGTARVSLCQHCGWQATCPNCDLPLTYHGDVHKMRCHVCNYSAETPVSCPTCGHAELVFKTIGTKAIVDEVTRLFPEAKVMRFDSDNLKAERFEQHYQTVVRGDVDIIIGTQTLAKGLDLPLLSTLGAVVADASLQMPDFTASERTYQLINQVLGRVQRGHRASHAVIQTYNPESPLLAAALHDDWKTFYARELEERNVFNYPPFAYLLKITCRRASGKSAEKACAHIARHIAGMQLPVQVDGPAPSLHERFKDSYSWQIVVKSRQRSALLTIIDNLPSTATSYDLDPSDLL